MNQKLKDQILTVSDSGLTNMFDAKAAQRIAYEMDFYEMVYFLEENPAAYIHFILYGEKK